MNGYEWRERQATTDTSESGNCLTEHDEEVRYATRNLRKALRRIRVAADKMAQGNQELSDQLKEKGLR